MAFQFSLGPAKTAVVLTITEEVRMHPFLVRGCFCVGQVAVLALCAMQWGSARHGTFVALRTLQLLLSPPRVDRVVGTHTNAPGSPPRVWCTPPRPAALCSFMSG